MHLVLEAMDKAPSLRAIWAGAAVLGLVGYATVRFRRWLVLPALALIAAAAWTQLGDLLDPQVGPAIMQQAGRWYVGQAGSAGGLGGSLGVVGRAPRSAG